MKDKWREEIVLEFILDNWYLVFSKEKKVVDEVIDEFFFF